MEAKDLASRISGMSDGEFREAAEDIARRLGLDERHINMITKNSAKVKRKIEGMSDKELRSAVDRLGEDRVRSVMDMMKER